MSRLTCAAFALAVAALSSSAARAAPAADAVTNIPGFGAPVSATYSGYLAAGSNQFLHYVYTASLQNPATDPLVIWFNGGPGCSSMEGLFSESGLYHVQTFTSPPTVVLNNFSWGHQASQIFLESPAGVGFSYCTKESACSHTDTSTAQDNLAALLSFFAAFPELAKNDFWISGESYAGVYIPSLAYAIYNHNQQNPATAINLKGIMVGNGCIGNAAGHCADTDPTGLSSYHDLMQWKGHGLISETVYDAAMAACSPNWANPSLQCDVYLAAASLELGNIDVYDIYNTCDDPASTSASSSRRLRAPVAKNSLLGRALAARRAAAETATPTGSAAALSQPIDSNCFADTQWIETYLNQPEAKAAFHVAPSIDFALCSNNLTFVYNSDIADERTVIYPTLTQQAGYKVLVFNGEADNCVPVTDNEWWTRSMNYSVVAGWKAWSVDSVYGTGSYVGGYVTQYAHNFTFATVRGAGHMVPLVRPEAAQELFRRHVLGKGWN